MKYFSNKICTEILNPHFIFSNFFSENHAFYEITSKNAVEPGRRQHSASALHAEQVRLHTGKQHTRASVHPARTHSPKCAHTHTETCNTYCFYTATMVMRTLPVLFSVRADCACIPATAVSMRYFGYIIIWQLHTQNED